MGRKKSGSKVIGIVIVVIIVLYVLIRFAGSSIGELFNGSRTFNLLAASSTSPYKEELEKFAEEQNIYLNIEYMDDMEIVETLNDDSSNYDAVWMSNSMWTYMLDNPYLVENSKSIAIDPVVIGIRKSKAEKLNFVGKNVYNKDILNAIKSGNLKYVMTSPLSTNTGATGYLAFLNSIAGSPEVLTEDMLDSQTLKSNMKAFFSGVTRTSGDEGYLEDMFVNGDYEAVISFESTLININKSLEKNNKEPLYLIYPKDGVALNDMPFAYVENDQKKEDKFELIQKFLRSSDTMKKLESKGFRTWYGGVNKNADSSVFKSSWGINTNEYLVAQKFPSKKVMEKAFDLYIEEFRRPGHFVFCLDKSGSMAGEGMNDLKDAMNYILTKEEASKARVQFSSKDIITVITFDAYTRDITINYKGNNTQNLIDYLNYRLYAEGGTNIYSPTAEALKILDKTDDSYTKTVILMTDGESNNGGLYEITDYLRSSEKAKKIPVYAITFGEASERQLSEITSLTNGKIFDGKSGLKKAFKEVRSYS